MRVGVYKGKNSIVVDDAPEPELAENDFLLAVGACGVCGSDLHAYAQGWPPVGTVMGHEFAGQVVKIGDAVAQVAVGDRVAVIPMLFCGDCRYCRQSRENLCEHVRGTAGGYAERVRLPEGTITCAMPDSMSMEEAAFLEPLSVAVRAVRLAGHPPEEPAIVVGLGSIGQLVTQVLKAQGVQCVIGIDLSLLRLRTAALLGADITLDPSDGDVVETLRSRIGGGKHRGYVFTNAATVFECSGANRVVGQAVTSLVRVAGTVVMAALSESDVAFDANPLVRKEISLIGSYAYTPEDVTEAFRLLVERQVDVVPLITHRRPLEAVDDAFAVQADKDMSVKVLVVPSSTAAPQA